MIQYLLGELSEAERDQLEDRLFSEETYVSQLQMIEEQLIDDYVYGVLPARQRTQFETQYLISARRQQKLRLAQELKQALETVPNQQATSASEGFWTNAKALWQSSAWRFGMATAVLTLLIIGGWWAIRSRSAPTTNSVPSTTVAVQTSQTAQAAGGILAQPTPAVTPTQSKPPVAVPTRAAQAVTVLSVLSPGLLRDSNDGADANLVRLSPGTTGITLQLRIQPNPSYVAYRVTIETIEGKRLLTRDHLRPRAAQSFLRVRLPAHALPVNDYVLFLSGKTSQGEDVEIDDYVFRVRNQ